MNEAETRAELIDPKLKACGWGVVEGSKILRERDVCKITEGRIQTGGRRSKPLIADYILVYKGFKLAVVDLPSGVFSGAGVKTVVLFFDKGAPTKKTWFYQLNLDRNLGKGNPLNEKDLADFVKLQKTKAESENSWSVDISSLNETEMDLSPKNPNMPEEAPLREPSVILENMKALDAESIEIMNKINSLIGK